MASNNWNNPTIGETHVDILSELKGRDVDVIKMIDDETPTNLPEKAKKWDDAAKVFKTWLSAVWTTLILGIAGGGTGSGTASGARTNLGVDSSTDVDTKVSTHAVITNPHSSTSIATANRLVLRDAAGRAAVVAPSAEGDIALKSNVTTVQGNLDTHAALANPHGAVSAPTASKLMLRDASGRAQVEDPSADKDIVNKQTLDAAQAELFGGPDPTISSVFYDDFLGFVASAELAEMYSDKAWDITDTTVPTVVQGSNGIIRLDGDAPNPCQILPYNSDVGLPYVQSKNPTVIVRQAQVASGAATRRFGLVDESILSDDPANGIFIRHTAGGHYFLVCRKNGIETTQLPVSAWSASLEDVGAAVNAGDWNVSTYWGCTTAPSATVPYITADLGSPKTVGLFKVYSIHEAANGVRCKGMTLQWSDNGSSWTQEGTYQHTNVDGEETFTLATPLSHRYWRVIVTSMWCTDGSYAKIFELGFFTDATNSIRDTGIAAANGTFHNLKFVVTGTTQVEIFVDSVSKGTVTFNIPTVSLYFAMSNGGSASGTGMDIDFVHISQAR